MLTILDITESVQYPPVQSSPTIDNLTKYHCLTVAKCQRAKMTSSNVPIKDTTSSSSNSSMSSSSGHEKEEELLDTCK